MLFSMFCSGMFLFSFHFITLVASFKAHSTCEAFLFVMKQADSLRQTACMVVNRIKIDNCVILLNCTTLSWASD